MPFLVLTFVEVAFCWSWSWRGWSWGRCILLLSGSGSGWLDWILSYYFFKDRSELFVLNENVLSLGRLVGGERIP